MTKRKVTEADKRASAKYRRTKMLSVAFRLSRVYEQDLIETYARIPQKSAWFKECIREYAKKHPE